MILYKKGDCTEDMGVVYWVTGQVCQNLPRDGSNKKTPLGLKYKKNTKSIRLFYHTGVAMAVIIQYEGENCKGGIVEQRTFVENRCYEQSNQYFKIFKGGK